MMALETVADYVRMTRTLLQDTVDSPYRYPDVELVAALSVGMGEAKRIRPDLFLNQTLPTYTVNDTTVVPFEETYRMVLVYYMCGHVQLRDDEEVQDQRAAAFLSLFNSKLTSVA
jgi:hypothetical protein